MSDSCRNLTSLVRMKLDMPIHVRRLGGRGKSPEEVRYPLVDSTCSTRHKEPHLSPKHRPQIHMSESGLERDPSSEQHLMNGTAAGRGSVERGSGGEKSWAKVAASHLRATRADSRRAATSRRRGLRPWLTRSEFAGSAGCVRVRVVYYVGMQQPESHGRGPCLPVHAALWCLYSWSRTRCTRPMVADLNTLFLTTHLHLTLQETSLISDRQS